MNTRTTLGALCAYAIVAATASAEPFTYQGSLNDNGAPANGEYDIRFELYDAPVGGTMIGGIQGVENTQVTDGLFTAELDFGSGAFDSGPRFLRIGVRPGDSGGLFTFLDPRTPINPTPKAQHATTADALTNPIWNQSGSVITAGDGLNRFFLNRNDFITDAEYFGVHADTTGFVGMYVSGPTNSFPFYGYSVNGDVSAFSYFNGNDDSLNFVGALGVNGFRLTAENNLEVANDVQAESYRYETPKLNYYSISGDSFHSASGDPFQASSGTGGAFITAPTVGWLVAPVNLPHGAVVTRMRVYFDDTIAADMTVRLNRRNHGGTASSALAAVDTAGFFGTSIEAIDSSIDLSTINNNLYHYHMRVFSSGWPGNSNLRIKSVVIEYTTIEAD